MFQGARSQGQMLVKSHGMSVGLKRSQVLQEQFKHKCRGGSQTAVQMRVRVGISLKRLNSERGRKQQHEKETGWKESFFLFFFFN